MITFEHCSLKYLNIWLSIDKDIFKTLNNGTMEEKYKAIEKAISSYGVARNVLDKIVKEKRLKRKYDPIIDVLEKVKKEDFKSKNIVEKVLEISNELSDIYERNLLSLTTKMLWLKIRSPIIIYDSRAKKDLRVRGNDLGEYYQKWKSNYSKLEPEIASACQILPNMNMYTINPEIGTKKYIAGISKEGWFRERVFDNFLWHGGLKEREWKK